MSFAPRGAKQRRETMDEKIMVGDVVRLRSGGPGMTVERISGESERISCAWFDETGRINRDNFNPAMFAGQGTR